MNTENKICQNCKSDFTIDAEDFVFYERMEVPPPTFCPACRFQRRLAFRNERKPFWNTSAKSGKRILALYPPEAGVTVYDDEEWKADDWDALRYGQDYDFSRPFFEQLYELSKKVPRPARSTEGNVNSEYLVNSGWVKNCYLICNTSGAEDCAYGNAVDYCKACFDNSHIYKCERSYGSFWIRNSHRTHFSTRSIDCVSAWFCFGTKGLTNCFGCVNLTNKSYHIFNQPYSKEEYERRLGEMRLDTWSGLERARAAAMAFARQFPYAYLNGTFHDNVTGEYISDSKNVHQGYLVVGGRDLKYVQYLQVPGAEDSYDLTIWGDKNVRAYENGTSGWGIANSKFLLECWSEIVDSEYSMFCRNISQCFGCVGLKNKKYCILNKQYSEEDYKMLVAKIKTHMDAMPYADVKGRVYRYGEFYPIEHSPFGYNTALVSEHFPLPKEQALAAGYSWRDAQAGEFETSMTADQLPDAIGEVPDAILKEVIRCAGCGRAYRIIPAELEFLRTERIPVPRTCVDCRHEARIAERAKSFLHHRSCECGGRHSLRGGYANFGTHAHGAARCPNEFETVYGPESEKIIYCLKCFWAEVG